MEENNTQPVTKSKTLPIILGVVFLLFIAGGAYLLMMNKNNTVSNQSGLNTVNENKNTDTVTNPTISSSTQPGESASGSAAVKTFKVAGSSFKFDPKEIRVNKGDTVRIEFTNSGGVHDWVLDEFNVRTKILESGASETVEFTADQAGTFEYYCSVGNHRQMGMTGNLIVE